ncbi:MAG: lysylphosphatidylglycerol synthase transmembrane domain-containing protein [bacterium]
MKVARRLRAAFESRALKLALSAALLAVLFRVTNLDTMRHALAHADWRWIVVALAFNLLSQMVSSYRWWLLTRAVGFDASLANVTAYYFSGMYLNLFGPGTVAGDVGRALFLADGRRRALALTTVVAHRAIGFVGLVWVGALGIVLVHSLPLPTALRVAAAFAVPLTLFAWLAGPRLAARLLPPQQRWRVLIQRDLAPYWHDRHLLAVSLGWAAAVHGLQISAQMSASRALGLTLPWSYFWVLVPLLNIGTTLPLSWSGIGVRETGYWYALSQLGVSEESGLAVGLLCSAIVLVTGLCGLPFFLALRRQPLAPRSN